MANLAALHDAVVAAPDDDDARRAYARAIAATDPARAELVELQLQLAAWRREGVQPAAWTDAQLRQHALRTAHGERWASDVRELVDGWVFRRGFVEEVTLPAARFLATAPELFRRAPVLHLTLTAIKPVAAELFASPHLDRIRSLSLRKAELGDAEAALLARSPHLGNLAWLDLGRNHIGRLGLEALAASDRLPRLRYLGFADNAIPDPTPQHADEYDADSALATELQAKYGPRPWLSVKGHDQWPPPRDAA